MSSAGGIQNYFSTHNALCHGDHDDGHILLHISKLEDKLKKVCFFVYPFNNVEMIKRMIMKKYQLPKSTNVSDICIFRKGSELRNNQSLAPFISDSKYAVLKLQWCFKDTTPGIGLRKIGLRPPPFLEELLGEIALAFQRGVAPKLTLDGTGGTYFLFNAKRKHVAMFKPRDEEAFAPNNPRGYEGHFGQKGFRAGVLSGEGASREVAAFLLDAQHGSLAGNIFLCPNVSLPLANTYERHGQKGRLVIFSTTPFFESYGSDVFHCSGVPETTQVEACHPSFCYKHTEHLLPPSLQHPVSAMSTTPSKRCPSSVGSLPFGDISHGTVGMPWKEGSLQEYLEAKDTCGDFNPHIFSVAESHYIGILDIRLLNLDRNDGNILVIPRTHEPKGSYEIQRSLTLDDKVSRYTLIPIDHGLILPACMDVGDIDLTWYTWPQSKVPFSEDELRHIFELDPDRDAARLTRKLDIREDCLRTMRVATRVLQLGSKMHLNLYQIASLVVRKEDFEKPSIMECAVKEALIQAYTAISASCLIQCGRVSGGLLLDLHNTEDNMQTLGCSTWGKQPDPLSCPDHTNGPLGVHDSSRQMKLPDSFTPTSPHPKDSTGCVQFLPQRQGKKTHVTPDSHMSPPDRLSSIRDTWNLWSSSSSDEEEEEEEEEENEDNEETPHERHRDSEDQVPIDQPMIACPLPCHGKAGVFPHHTSTPLVNPQANGLTNEATSNTQDSNDPKHKHSISPPQKAGAPCTHPCVGTTKTTSCQNLPPLLRTFKNGHSGYTRGAHRLVNGTRWGSASHRSTRTLGANLKSSWTLRDSNKKLIYLDWTNEALERTFFYCFEHLIQHYITELYPDWKTFPFRGDQLLKEMENSLTVGASHKRRSGGQTRSTHDDLGVQPDHDHCSTKYSINTLHNTSSFSTSKALRFNNIQKNSTVASAC